MQSSKEPNYNKITWPSLLCVGFQIYTAYTTFIVCSIITSWLSQLGLFSTLKLDFQIHTGQFEALNSYITRYLAKLFLYHVEKSSFKPVFHFDIKLSNRRYHS